MSLPTQAPADLELRRVAILLCTFRRQSVFATLESLAGLQIPDDCALFLIVIDNDDTEGARHGLEEAFSGLPFPAQYRHAPARNISRARNGGLEAASGLGAEWIVFLDDDERAPPAWLTLLFARQRETEADAVFGPSRAVYPDTAPEWMRQNDFHSNHPVVRQGVVETGHTCNALVRWRGTAWEGERFDERLGRSGGEDTDFFFRLRRTGAKFAASGEAVVFETVEAPRLSSAWIGKRKFRSGQIYAVSATSPTARLGLLTTAGLKAGYCLFRAGLSMPFRTRHMFWRMRGVMHLGVCAGCLGLKGGTHYGR